MSMWIRPGFRGAPRPLLEGETAEALIRVRDTARGKCCSGLLPLLLDEALEHAERFPLAMV
ncbi:MAG: hypothetical protein K9H25_14950 [Rhodospirillum sp.]|nr:hypothetical protein [Rhodospirillum sp.]MCF8492072.1 hypothetical protein [Rhodospirillum sp.]MCF8502071.1 hypothetical protein [Rhodospirillum sp.]